MLHHPAWQTTVSKNICVCLQSDAPLADSGPSHKVQIVQLLKAPLHMSSEAAVQNSGSTSVSAIACQAELDSTCGAVTFMVKEQ